MRRLVFSLLVLTLLLTASPSVEAGIFDSIKGFFGKASNTVKGWFSGGGTKEFEEMLQKVIASQEVVNEKQNAVYDLLTHRTPQPTDPDYQKKMNELAEASRSNEDLYTQLLTVRQELVDKKRDVSKYDEHLKRIQETQHNLEEGYQAIQEQSKKMGAFKPPAQVAKEKAAGGGNVWANADAQQYIDEWLAANGLNQFGVLEGGVVVTSANPDFEGSRHQFVWEQLASQNGRVTGTTLEQYVKMRMQGGIAAPPAGGMETASASTGGSSGGEMERGSGTSSVGTATQVATPTTDGSLSGTEEQLKAAMKAYEDLSAKGQGNSAEGKRLVQTIQTLKTQRDQMIRQKSAANQ